MKDLSLDEDSDGVDAPRAAQWVDDNDTSGSGESAAEDSSTEASSSRLKTLQSNLSNLPLGALRKAQRVLKQVEPISDSDDSSGDELEDDTGESESEHEPGLGSSKGKEWSVKPRFDISKRSSKHAPTEVTSKRPVTRRRTVVEVPKLVARDPRFLPTAGEFAEEKFQKQYAFLTDAHKTELRTLRENLKRARKFLASSPREHREEREQEVYRLEQAVKRTESLVNKDRLDQVLREALGKATKEEKTKRKQGKGGWWMKESDKRELLTQARYEALAADGGSRAVKKAIEKKQKKVSQKEKKSRPYPPSRKKRRVE
ncbi:uncharacterized protein LACBIDRAFT_300621 [Laccaria bicolor S238N-H82]|uniref:rRNA biogenesis protein RRP36 n=1 Tax=Laccaria bicolor (strain S238N-H82 / ATCC MYA-4686) TaxID=486041 RepID=RRP36_LACBS|nr:uncharacterized protein LACBIDRAFT_300621 [Laccaria bicolor S238N-H82]B0CPQ8.1 RecName: Full=rRNA biogenesis protein RRP36; AltName: Full=Ribosomal RNA-processing protein 36 [Laccaria bicolor S238N-H82]EDR14971.1 predicted protein [Laccaria bicolor S238N-H82]|eukprot:XP_001873179.1 predicted protein [Laccaria bicolor S238N-H82]